MADLFISYASRDRAFVAPLVDYLEHEGYSIWWDRHIDAGSTFDRDIENALDAAKCVVVIWSRNSVESNWVRAEANEGLGRNILVPVIIDDARPPLIFRSLQNLEYRLGNEGDLERLASAIGKVAPAIQLGQIDRTGERTPEELEQRASEAVNRGHWSIPPFVGRENLLNSLRDMLTMAGRGTGQVAMLSGEPGIGKSRTAQEFGERARQIGFAVFSGWCDESMYSPPYWPLTRLLRTILEELNPPLRREELGSGSDVLSGILPELREWFPDIGPVPEYSPEHLNFETAQALFNLLRKVSERRPLLLLLDDLHCADEQTLTVLMMLCREIGRSSIMLLGGFRDTDIGSDHSLVGGLTELSRTGRFRRFHIGGLSREEVTRFLIENVSASETLADTVIEKTDGNPLFVTEIGRSIQAEGSDATLANSGEIVVPRSLQELVLGRLRSLTPGCRHFLDVSSVMGRTIAPEIVCEVGDIDAASGQAALSEASQAGVIDSGPSGTLRFAHIILRDALYDELSPGKRVDWHRASAEHLVDRADAHVGMGSHYETIAHHYQQAGLIDAALDYWEQAATIARSQSAHADAVVRLNQALSLIADSESSSSARVEREIRLRLSLGGAYITFQGAGSADAVPEFRRALELCNLYPDSPSLFYALNGVWSYHAMHCNSEAVALVDRQLELADRLESQTATVLASNAEATTRFFEGDMNAALLSLERASCFWNEMRERRLARGKVGPSLSYAMGSALYHAWCLALVGRADDGLKLAERTLAQSLDLGTHSHVQALTYVAVIHETTCNYQRLREISREIIELAETNGYVSWLAVARCTHGLAISHLGDPAEGLSEAQAGCEAYRELGGFLCLTWRQLHLAQILRMNGRLADAIGMVDQTLAASIDRFEHFADPELYRLRGECLIELDNAEGLDWLYRAHRLAASRGARLFELRTLASLVAQEADPEHVRQLQVLFEEAGKGVGNADRERVSAVLTRVTGNR